MLKGIVEWVERKFTGPLRLTAYVNLPSAANFARSLIWNTSASLPEISDDSSSGAWLWIPAYATGAATAVSNAGTINKRGGQLTTESLSTVAGSAQVLTITSSEIAATDLVFASVQNSTNTSGTPIIGRVTPASGSVAVEVRNIHASAAFSGTLIITFFALKA
jgi:hypothetical protein